MPTKKKEVAKKATPKKVVSKSVAKRIKIQKEVEVKAPKIEKKHEYPIIDGLKVVEILDGSTPTEKNCKMSDGTTRFVESERFTK